MLLRRLRRPDRIELRRETLHAFEIAPRLLLTTLTNRGYLPYTRNLLASLASLGLRERILVFCADPESAAALRAEGVEAIALPLPEPIADLQLFRRGSFRDLVRQKLALVRELLDLGFCVLFTDGDVVFLRDPIPDLRTTIGRAEILMQNDDRHDSRRTRTKRIDLCTGFFLATPTRATRRVFDPRRLTDVFRDDQEYFNAHKRGLRIGVLDRARYPNGSWLLEREGVDPEDALRDAFVVHFNHRIGAAKQAEMHRLGVWRVGDAHAAPDAGSAPAARPQQPQATP